jgi:hypothetical protein
MEATGHDRLDGILKVSLAKCPPSVEVLAPLQVPDEYWVERTQREISKRKILEAWKSGLDDPERFGCRIVTDRRVLRIK